MSTVSREVGGRRMLVYHEKQTLLMQHCAVHTLNNVLQGPFYTAKHFEDLAYSLQHGGFLVDLSERQNIAGPAFTHAAGQPVYNSSAGSNLSPGTSVGCDSATAETEECSTKCTTEGLSEGFTRDSVPAKEGCSPAKACQSLAWNVEAPAAWECVSRNTAPSSFETLRFPTHEKGLSWRTRISSVLLGTDYSAPLGIGNYDLSLLQQLLCFHQLSLNFANNPSRVKTTKHDAQECRLLPSVENPDENGASLGDLTEPQTFLKRQQCPLPREEQTLTHRSRHEQQLEHQVQHDTLGISTSSCEGKDERDEAFRGCVTIEQLRNPRLLAFILNVEVRHRGWRRLLSVLRADRHFYTIRKVSCGRVARCRLHPWDISECFIPAALRGVTNVLTAGKLLSAEVRTNHDELLEQSDQRREYIESGNRDRLRPQNAGEEDICTGQAICENLRGSRMTDGCHWKGENSVSKQSLAFSSGENTCDVPQGKYGVHFVWLNLDSNLSTPRVFKSENALLLYLNRMLKEAFSERGRSRTDQVGTINQPVQKVNVQDIATVSSRCVAPVGTNSEAGSCDLQEVGLVSGVGSESKDAAVSRRSIVDSIACGQGCVDSGLCKTFGDDRGRRRGSSGREEGYDCSCGRYHADLTGYSQYPDNVTCALEGGNLTFGLTRSSRSSRHTERNGSPKFKRAQERREKTIMPQAFTRDDEVADNVRSLAYTERGLGHEGLITSQMYCDAMSEGDEEEGHTSYKDLILIEVLKDGG